MSYFYYVGIVSELRFKWSSVSRFKTLISNVKILSDIWKDCKYVRAEYRLYVGVGRSTIFRLQTRLESEGVYRHRNIV